MAYVGIGNRQDYVADFQSQNFSGDGSTTAFTLNYEAVTGSIRVAVDNVLQPADGSSYTVDGFTLTFDSAPASGTNNITVLFLGTVRNISSVSDGAIVASKLASNAVETAKIADGAVTSAKLDSGKVLQVTNIASASTTQTLATTTYTDLTSLSVSITPSSTSSKILIHTQIGVDLNGDEGYGIRFLRDATDIYTTVTQFATYTGSANNVYYQNSFTYIDSPSTTSALTYKVQAGSYAGNSIRFNNAYNSNVYLMEISG